MEISIAIQIILRRITKVGTDDTDERFDGVIYSVDMDLLQGLLLQYKSSCAHVLSIGLWKFEPILTAVSCRVAPFVTSEGWALMSQNAVLHPTSSQSVVCNRSSSHAEKNSKDTSRDPRAKATYLW